MFSKWRSDSAGDGFSFRRLCTHLKTISRQSIGYNLRRLPLTIKITGWYSIFLLLMLLLLSTFIMQFTNLWEDSELRGELQATVINVADNPKRFHPYHDGIFMVMYTDNGIAVKGAIPDGFPSGIILSPHRITELTTKESTYYYYDSPSHSGEFHGWVRGILPVTTINRRTNIMLMALMFGGLAFLIIGTCGGYWLIKRGLKPIRMITQTAAEIGRNRDLSQRIEQTVNSHDEIATLSDTFNGMLTNLEESSMREKQFSSDVSHELRTPIAVIQAESDYGRTYITSVEEAKESFEHIFKQSRFMTSMVTQLLDVARLDTMRDIEMRPFNLSQFLEDISQGYSRLCADKNLTFDTQIAQHLQIVGNPTFLKRAIGNLLDNAMKFTTDKVGISAKNHDGTVRIIVSDNGIGIQESDLTKIWDRLYQVETSRTKSNNQGLGLGLYFVQNVIKLHGAKAYARSTPNVKTEFILEFDEFIESTNDK